MPFDFAANPKLDDLRARLVGLGCEIKDLSGEFVTLEGSSRILYARNPQNGRFIILPIIDQDARISPWHIGNIERRLNLITGFPTL